MRRHSSIQLLLLSLTGCSWMLLFLILTLSDYHAFKAYHAAHVAAAPTTPIPTPKEIDPCDLCWGLGRNDPKSSLQRSRSISAGLSGIAGWGARLARAVGVGGQDGHLNVTSLPTAPPSERVGGVGAFYYYTLHTTFTSLRSRLKKAQQVAGDVQTDVASLEEKVARLQNILVNQFSPSLNPYQANSSLNKHSTNLSAKQVDGNLTSTNRLLKSYPNVHTSKNYVFQNQLTLRFSKTTPKSVTPVKDIYALIHEQTQRVYHEQPNLQFSKPKEHNKKQSQNIPKSNSFYRNRNILSYSSGKYEHSYTNSSSQNIHQPSVNETSGMLKTDSKNLYSSKHNQIKTERSLHERTKCQMTRKDKDHINSLIIKTRNEIPFLVSVILLGQEESTNEQMAALSKQYPGITVHLLTSLPYYQLHNELRVVVHYTAPNTSLGTSYSNALNNVITQYVLIATNISEILTSNSLEKLIWAMENLGVWAVSGGLQSPSGHWHMGCLEMHVAHYQVTWTRRVVGTASGCSLCHSLEGPFLAVTSALRHLSWDTALPSSVAQLELFLRASQNHYMLSAVCPQVLFNTTHELTPHSRASLLGLAKKHSFYSLKVPMGVHFRFTCDEVAASCSTVGLALPPCCRQELARVVRFFMDACDSHGLLCELQEGTLLGAIKTGGIMPWERDADITFHTNNFTALGELRDVFERNGYSLHLVDNRWCCVDGRKAGGQGTLNTAHWSLELYSQHAMDSEDDLLSRRPRTRVEFDGSWVIVPTNPGLYARNRYGTEMYRHAQHWLDTGRKSGWEEYDAGRFLPCSRPAHHACLDQYLPDGNFKLYPQCLA